MPLLGAGTPRHRDTPICISSCSDAPHRKNGHPARWAAARRRPVRHRPDMKCRSFRTNAQNAGDCRRALSGIEWAMRRPGAPTAPADPEIERASLTRTARMGPPTAASSSRGLDTGREVRGGVGKDRATASPIRPCGSGQGSRRPAGLRGDDRFWILGDPLVVEVGDGERIEVPVGFTTDGASVPTWAQKVTGWDPWVDPQRWAGVVHDWLYSQPGVSKSYADAVFRALLASDGRAGGSAK
jgi:hypothetical protein